MNNDIVIGEVLNEEPIEKKTISLRRVSQIIVGISAAAIVATIVYTIKTWPEFTDDSNIDTEED